MQLCHPRGPEVRPRRNAHLRDTRFSLVNVLADLVLDVRLLGHSREYKKGDCEQNYQRGNQANGHTHLHRGDYKSYSWELYSGFLESLKTSPRCSTYDQNRGPGKPATSETDWSASTESRVS